ncbi:MAG: hypothetical protein GY858_00655 [Candidatus Omnitrophica bacterium]|nr:hypothetical protein [Candidatus Omnitrophota bacterium]
MKNFIDKLFKVVFFSGVIAYLFLFTFYPILHNHSDFLLSQDYCEFHDEHEHNSSENNNPDDPDCPACEFLNKASLGIVADVQILLGANSSLVAPAAVIYHQPYRDVFYHSFLGRSPPLQFITV